jgi:replicative superfamily II helicase
LLVLTTLSANPGAKVLYLVPSNALVYQVASDLAAQLEPADVSVSAVTPQLVALEVEEDARLADADVLVLTPEKADLLLRIGAQFLDAVSLVVVDEAHLIEDGTRGVLLELYLTRLKGRFAERSRYVLLSAVAPNVGQIARWVSPNARSSLFTRRATRMRVGVYKIKKPRTRREGWIDYVFR